MRRQTLRWTIGQLVFEFHYQCLDRLTRSIRKLLARMVEEIAPMAEGIRVNGVTS